MTLIMLLSLLASCKTKTEAAQVKIIPKSVEEAKSKLLSVFKEELEYKIIKCPKYFESPFSDRVTKRCFTINQEPEDVLVDISSKLKFIGDQGMQWRLDIGQWVTTYDFDGEKFGVLVSLVAVGNSELLRNDPNLKDIKTVGEFIIADERTKTP